MTQTERTTPGPNILVFDSGVGGLSILAAIREQVPGCNLTYASDNAAFPYGIKGESELVERVERVLRQILQAHPIDIIVVACNSASTLALPHIRSHFQQPIVGVVPAIKPAAQYSRSKVIGLLATPGTIARPYTQDLIDQFADNCEVIRLGSSELVLMAEQKLRGVPVDTQKLNTVMADMDQHPSRASMDTLVLACTHFPLLRPELARHFGGKVTLIDSGEAIARRVKHWVDHLALGSYGPGRHQALFTRDTQEVQTLEHTLKDMGITRVSITSVPV